MRAWTFTQSPIHDRPFNYQPSAVQGLVSRRNEVKRVFLDAVYKEEGKQCLIHNLLTPRFGTVKGIRPDDLDGTRPRIGSLFRLSERYLRSVHLERDFDDPTSLNNYVTTPTMVAQFRRFFEGLRPGSGHRAWRITGDYGTGKSAFALVLAHLLRESDSVDS